MLLCANIIVALVNNIPQLFANFNVFLLCGYNDIDVPFIYLIFRG